MLRCSLLVHNASNDVSADLADYMIRVAEDDHLFASYFWWKDFYRIADMGDTLKSVGIASKMPLSEKYLLYAVLQAYCSLCQALHNDSEKASVITDFKKYWTEEAHCHSY